MASPIIETKIELVTESIEALVLASIIAATAADKDRALNHQNVLDARETLKGCLKEFLAPTLRVMTNDKMPVKPEVVLYGGIGIDGMNLG